MPFTPFHLGPGLLVALLCVRWLDFPTVLLASVLVDVRTALVFFGVFDGPLHGPLHTFFGATVLAMMLSLAVVPVRPTLDRTLEWLRLPQPTDYRRVIAGALVGAWLHVLLDATLYTDVQPFAPVTATNPFLGAAGPVSVYAGCLVAGALGAVLYVALVFDAVTLVENDAV